MRFCITALFVFLWSCLFFDVARAQAPTVAPTRTPTVDPTAAPSEDPTYIPSAEPTFTPVPTVVPTVTPVPTRRPTRQPTYTVTAAPSTKRPTRQPTSLRPTRFPFTANPSIIPTEIPTSKPTNSHKPSRTPTSQPSRAPSSQPSTQPSRQPSNRPSRQPSAQPTTQPSMPTGQPTSVPSQFFNPTSQPTTEPSVSRSPTRPTVAPTFTVTRAPSVRPTRLPTISPTAAPTTPTASPTTARPSASPTVRPTRLPTFAPTNPTGQPSSQPSLQPFTRPTSIPTSRPTARPSGQPTAQPTMAPSYTKQPSKQPSSQPSGRPSKQPSNRPTSEPTNTRHPTNRPTGQPSTRPSRLPSRQPTSQPTAQPSRSPTGPTPLPTSQPSRQPSSQPSRGPSSQPSRQPSRQPSSQPSSSPTNPTGQPSTHPSVKPTPSPTPVPSVSFDPTGQPTGQPSSLPSSQPSLRPTSFPSLSWKPTVRPSSRPSSKPTARPSGEMGFHTLHPTQLYVALVEPDSAAVELLPALTLPCQSVALTLSLTLNRNVSAGTRLVLATPGLTSGPCESPARGKGVAQLVLGSSANLNVRGSYEEGRFEDGFQASAITLTLLDDFFAWSDAREVFVHVDRLNGLRAACLSATNTSWAVFAYPTGGREGGHVAEATVNNAFFYSSGSFRLKANCLPYASALSFDQPFPQFQTGLNLSFYLPLPLAGPDAVATITVTLPFFTNLRATSAVSSAVHPQSRNLATQALSVALDASLVNISASTNFAWFGRVIASPDTSASLARGASFEQRMKARFGVTLVLTAAGRMSVRDTARPFWIYIPAENRLTPACGVRANTSEFTFEVSSQFYRVAQRVFDSVAPIGAACGAQHACHGNGDCDYATQTCRCFDGFGSESDRKFLAIGDSAPLDCSGRVCPAGPALFAQGSYEAGRANLSLLMDPHRLVECSGGFNGLCDRQTGRCVCRAGFSGPACERQDCQAGCSDRGRCLRLQRLGRDEEALPLSLATYTPYDDRKVYGFRKASAAWDAARASQCVCDSSWPVGLQRGQTQLAEFFGPACELRRCPSGDNPDTAEDETDCEGKAQTAGGRDLGQPGNRCHVDCSDRGLCDYASGLCRCFDGYFGHNCASKNRL